jgi:hypothetical protein
MHTHSPKKLKKFKQTSARKLMATIFWDKKEVLMVEFMQPGTAVMSEMYCKTLKELCRAIQVKRHGMLTYGIMLLCLNVRPHISTTACTRAHLEHFNWELFDHPFYSCDLAPNDYHLFT